MADLTPTTTQLVPMTDTMTQKHTQIRINEKLSNIKGLKQRLDDLKSIEAKKLELQIETLEREIDFLNNKIIDLETKEVK